MTIVSRANRVLSMAQYFIATQIAAIVSTRKKNYSCSVKLGTNVASFIHNFLSLRHVLENPENYYFS